MTLRTPRRRISPRAKRKYRVIRDFFRRALGSPSQQDIQINSSIALNVTDLKHKIIGLEHDINAVSKSCLDHLACFENTFRNGVESVMLPTSDNDEESALATSLVTSAQQRSNATELIYQPDDNRFRKFEDSDYDKLFQQTPEAKRTSTTVGLESAVRIPKEKHKNKSYDKVQEDNDKMVPRKHKPQTIREKLSSACNSYSLQSLRHARGAHEQQRDTRRTTPRRREHKMPDFDDDHKHNAHRHEAKRNKSDPIKYEYEEKHARRKKREDRPKVDDDFLSDIIKRQYKPVTVFGRNQSDLSQFSMPVCRDVNEYYVRPDIPEVCSCYYEPTPRYVRGSPHRSPQNFGDIRSMCDTRLYSTKRYRPRRHERYMEDYNDAAYYDVVPVKEKPNPKSRRKMVEDDMFEYHYKEVPPSPRTHRPRLNLKAQHCMDYDDYEISRHHNRKHKKQQEYVTSQSDVTTEQVVKKNHKDKNKVQKSMKEHAAGSTMDTACNGNEQGNLTATDNTFTKPPLTDRSDKTDKALCEIKDILQTFLQEIKKETAPIQTNNSNEKQVANNYLSQKSAAILPTVAENIPGAAAVPIHNGVTGCTVCNAPQSTGPPNGGIYPNNPCCCPVFPIYPYVPNAYVVPSHSFSCHTCVNASIKDASCQECLKHKKNPEEGDVEDKNNETEMLIKEIYKFVAQNPNVSRKKERHNFNKESEEKLLTSRSVGGSSFLARHDMKVGTPALRCYSKSCEAIGSRMIAETCTNTTHSDTIIEKMTLDMPTTTSDTELTSYFQQKTKVSRFGKVFKSIGLFKKKKTSTSETESSYDLGEKMRHPPPFRQEITNYMMHGQEFTHTPPHTGRLHPRDLNYRPGDPQYRPGCPDCKARDPHSRPEDPHCVPRHPNYQPGDPHHRPREPHCRPGDQHCRPGDQHCRPGVQHCRPEDSHYKPRDRHYTTTDRCYDPRSAYPFPQPGYHTCPPYGHHVHGQTIHEHSPYPPPSRNQHAQPSSYYNPYDNMYSSETSSQLPVCLREVEVKSTGTQSERKMAFFQKLGKKSSPPAPLQPRRYERKPFDNQSRVTGGGRKNSKEEITVEPAIPSFRTGWKKFKDKVKHDIQDDPMAYGFRTNSKLKQGDMKMRNAIIKKLFFKRNPFSPNNLILKTILGSNEPSASFPDQQQLRMRPRFFF